MNKLKIISILILSTLILLGTTSFAKTGTVNAPNGLVLRNEASKSAKPITTVYDNAKVEILEQSGEWYKVKYGEQEGYVAKRLVVDKIEEAITIGFYLPYSFANSFYRKQYRKEFNELLEKILPYNFKLVF